MEMAREDIKEISPSWISFSPHLAICLIIVVAAFLMSLDKNMTSVIFVGFACTCKDFKRTVG